MGNNPKVIIETPKGKVITVTSKNGAVSAKLVWNPGFGPKFSKKLQSGQAKLDMEVMKQLEPYMQLVTSAMIKSMYLATDVGSGLIRVKTPYARRVHYSRAKIGRPTGPLRGPYYFQRMKADRLTYLHGFAAKVVGAK